jgi:CBS domain
MQVSEAMTSDVKIANPNQTIRDAARIMAQIDAGVLPVGENDRLVGMITDRDIAIRAIAADKGPQTPIREVMSKEVMYCFEDDDLEDVVQKWPTSRYGGCRCSIAISAWWESSRSAISRCGQRTVRHFRAWWGALAIHERGTRHARRHLTQPRMITSCGPLAAQRVKGRRCRPFFCAHGARASRMIHHDMNEHSSLSHRFGGCSMLASLARNKRAMVDRNALM